MNLSTKVKIYRETAPCRQLTEEALNDFIQNIIYIHRLSFSKSTKNKVADIF